MGRTIRAGRLIVAIAVAGLLATSAGPSVVAAAPTAPGPGLPREATAAAGIFYVSPSGSDANAGTKSLPWKTIQHAADTLIAGQTVYIRAGTYKEHVLPQNSGAAGAYITYAAYPGEVPVLDGTGIALPNDLAGLFDVRFQSWIRVTGLHVSNAGPANDNAGIMVFYSDNVVVEGNHTLDTRSSGIGVWYSANVTVRGNEIVRACHGPNQEAISLDHTDTFLVERNTVRDSLNKEGITVKNGSHDGAVFGNVVSNVPKVGIYLDGASEKKGTYNIEISGNTVRSAGDGISIASEVGGPVSHVRVVNNVVVDSMWVGIVVTTNDPQHNSVHHPISDVAILNNTVWRNGYRPNPANGVVWGGGLALDDPDATGVVVRDNIFSASNSFQMSRGIPKSQTTAEYNLIDGYRASAGNNEIFGDHAVLGAPRFVDATHGDFHVLRGSPAIDAGTPTGAPAADFDGRARPLGRGFDIGAFEYVDPSSVAVGSSHACAIVGTGVRCWGSNRSGQLGNGTPTSSMKPVVVSRLTGVRALAAGSAFTCALLADQTVKCWGSNAQGQLGDGTLTRRTVPVAVKNLAGVKAIVAGEAHACALVTTGGVVCWGSNASGQLGDGTLTRRLTRVAVKSLTGVSAIAAGAAHTCAVVAGGVRCWGSNGSGQLGDGTLTRRLTRVTVKNLSGVSAITAGATHTCAAVAAGGVKCWGGNSSGQLGDGTRTLRRTPVSVAVRIVAVALAAGANHTCALSATGRIRCWGANLSGQLGDGTLTTRPAPVATGTVAWATRLAAGGSTTCAIVAAPVAWCWGLNEYGQVGDGTLTTRTTPVRVVSLAP